MSISLQHLSAGARNTLIMLGNKQLLKIEGLLAQVDRSYVHAQYLH
jgi:hypothetical protein